MNFEEAMEWRNKGYSIRRETWHHDRHFNSRTEKNALVFDATDIDANDWEIVSFVAQNVVNPIDSASFLKNYAGQILAEGPKKQTDDKQEKSPVDLSPSDWGDTVYYDVVDDPFVNHMNRPTVTQQDKINKLHSEGIHILQDQIDHFQEELQKSRLVPAALIAKVESIRTQIEKDKAVKNNDDFLLKAISTQGQLLYNLSGDVQRHNELEEKFKIQHNFWSECVKKMNLLEEKLLKDHAYFSSYIAQFDARLAKLQLSIDENLYLQNRVEILESFGNHMAIKMADKKTLE